jgi:hypothetical protein
MDTNQELFICAHRLQIINQHIYHLNLERKKITKRIDEIKKIQNANVPPSMTKSKEPNLDTILEI